MTNTNCEHPTPPFPSARYDCVYDWYAGGCSCWRCSGVYVWGVSVLVHGAAGFLFESACKMQRYNVIEWNFAEALSAENLVSSTNQRSMSSATMHELWIIYIFIRSSVSTIWTLQSGTEIIMNVIWLDCIFVRIGWQLADLNLYVWDFRNLMKLEFTLSRAVLCNNAHRCCANWTELLWQNRTLVLDSGTMRAARQSGMAGCRAAVTAHIIMHVSAGFNSKRIEFLTCYAVCVCVFSRMMDVV